MYWRFKNFSLFPHIFLCCAYACEWMVVFIKFNPKLKKKTFQTQILLNSHKKLIKNILNKTLLISKKSNQSNNLHENRIQIDQKKCFKNQIKNQKSIKTNWKIIALEFCVSIKSKLLCYWILFWDTHKFFVPEF